VPHLWRGEESASFFRTLSSRAVRLHRYTANRRQHGCAERHPPSSPRPLVPTPQLHNSQLLSMIDRPTDTPTHRPTHRPIHRSNRRHGSEVADIQVPLLRRRTGLGLTALIGDLFLISSRRGRHGRLGQPGQVGEPQPLGSAAFDQTTVVASDAPQAWTLARTVHAQENSNCQ